MKGWKDCGNGALFRVIFDDDTKGWEYVENIGTYGNVPNTTAVEYYTRTTPLFNFRSENQVTDKTVKTRIKKE